MQQGELTVTGHDHATIPLHRFPTKIECHFKDKTIPVPCNPHHHDELECEAQYSDTILGDEKFALKIRWKVSGVRQVVWIVYY